VFRVRTYAVVSTLWTTVHTRRRFPVVSRMHCMGSYKSSRQAGDLVYYEKIEQEQKNTRAALTRAGNEDQRSTMNGCVNWTVRH